MMEVLTKTGACGGGFFHRYRPADDGFCAGCRPEEGDPRVLAAKAWWAREKKEPFPERGTEAWADALAGWALETRGGTA